MLRLALAVAVIAACGGDDAPAFDAGPPPCGEAPWYCELGYECDVCGSPQQRLCECVNGVWVEGSCPLGVGTCNALAQVGCPAGERCGLFRCGPGSYSSGWEGCMPDGTIALGEPCEPAVERGEYDECADNALCYQGICRAFCFEPNVPCPDGERCAAVTGSPYPLCLPDCTPLESCARPDALEP